MAKFAYCLPLMMLKDDTRRVVAKEIQRGDLVY